MRHVGRRRLSKTRASASFRKWCVRKWSQKPNRSDKLKYVEARRRAAELSYTVRAIRDLTQLLREVVAEYAANGISARQINDGRCADFAQTVFDRWQLDKKLSITNNEELAGGEYTHTFLAYDCFYFDAECTEGVMFWVALPIFVREGLNRAICEGLKKAVGDIV